MTTDVIMQVNVRASTTTTTTTTTIRDDASSFKIHAQKEKLCDHRRPYLELTDFANIPNYPER